MAGEFDFIRWIQRQQAPAGRIITTAGDDMAVVKWDPTDLLLAAVDQVIDGVHFLSQKHSPRQIGRKVMNRNLSDCAAMACLPAAALACVALPRGSGQEYAQELYQGMREAADRFACPIIGGDTGSWEGKLVLSVTMLGRSAGVQPVLRSGAKVGDWIYVSGALGGSILGRHIDFEPRIELARELASRHRLTAMIDISDGLSRDLAHICHASGVGAVVEADALPVHADAGILSQQDGITPVEHALHDGEDHELLFTCPDEIATAGVIRIGRICEGQALMLRQDQTERPLEPKAWEHRL